MSDQTEDFEMVWQRMEYATEEHAKILVVNADLRQRIAEIEAQLAEARNSAEVYLAALHEIELFGHSRDYGRGVACADIAKAAMTEGDK